ncbi:MAG: DUF4350 domain-containing protein, partial [Asgard group archaeon]|nr:DUF4350 domain-containing protein [Asgard group archaeon]
MAKKKFDKNSFFLAILFIIFLIPMILSLTHIGQEGTRQFSMYNTGWDGTSVLKENLESEGYSIQPILSTLNSLTRVDDLGTLVIMGPTIFYDPTETAALGYFLARGGSVLLADDFGSANDILVTLNTVLAPFLDQISAQISPNETINIPLRGFKINNSLLMDSQSNHRSPVMPVLRNFYTDSSLPTMTGVNSVVTSFPSALSFLVYDNATETKKWVPTFTYSGSPIPSGLAISTDKSWLEKDVDKAKSGDFYPDDDEWGGISFSVLLPLPASTVGLGNIILCSDPSIFINELITMTQYDNAQFASNLFNWLDINNTKTIYFDESHLSIAEGQAGLSIIDPFSYMRMYLRIIDSLTMFPLLAPFFPIIAFIYLRRYFPKTKKPKPLLMTKIKQSKSRSFFAAKMYWYITYQR